MSHVVLTGVTGFVGKVVLEDLLRRKNELGIERVTVLIRASERKGVVTSASARFSELTTAKVFRRLPADWALAVDVVACDLSSPGCGILPADYARITQSATHIIHCAASVEFDLPVAEAAKANITTALEVLELARACKRLAQLVDVSTAYVTPWRDAPIRETLAHLPRPAEEYHRAIVDGTRNEAEILAETGHPNTYTLTKCITEHLLFARAAGVPVRIVRPSIVSASWREPFPGWVDSPAALAGCLLYTGLGLVRAFNADPDVRLDVVPVDVCAQVIVEAAFAAEHAPIRYAVMGVEHALRVDMAALSTIAYFSERPGAKSVPGMFIGTDAHGFSSVDRVRRGMRTQVLRGALALTGRKRDKRSLEKVDEKVRYLNSAFRYFTHHSFDFQPAQSCVPQGYDPVAYMQSVNDGLYRNLLKLDPHQMPLAGLAHDDARSDFAWLQQRRVGAWPMQALALGMRKALRRCASSVTFDRPSFERAVKQAPADALFVLAPSHRSYFDFLLTSYLCFQHPELGIEVPHIAAAEEFSKIPLVGELLRACRAFFIRRGVGKEVPELSQELKRIAGKGASIMFFIEGQRSRAREFLPPKRGLLKGLQATGRRFAVLPIAISYDRVPDSAALERELAGGTRSKMSLQAIVGWLMKLARGEVDLGRVHIVCGDPLLLDADTNVATLAAEVMAQQQSHTAVSRFHVRSFLTESGLLGIDEDWLVNAIVARGGRVLESELRPAFEGSPQLHMSLRNQWKHWFYGDALALYPWSVKLREHVASHAFMPPSAAGDLRDPHLTRVVRVLFSHIVEPDARTKPRRTVSAQRMEVYQ